MKDLLVYYKRELTELQRLGELFAKKHPKIAAQLGLNEHAVKDPNISRLIESVALMNARINYKLDDDFSEISEALLNILFPSYLAPVPPLSILQFGVMPDVATTVSLSRETAIEAIQPDSSIVRFKTCYDVELLPIEITAATLTHSPMHSHSVGELKLSLRTLDNQTLLSDLRIQKIRFFLNGLSHHTHPLYELLFNHLNGIALSSPEKQRVELSRDHIKPVGFHENETVLPYDSRTPLGYHLLNEYFVFPEKFLFFELVLPENAQSILNHTSAEIAFYLNEAPLELQKNITAKTFALNCAPIINLFTKTLEPVSLTHTHSEYLLTPDIREPECYEIYQLHTVGATTPSEEIKTFLPFYGFSHYGASSPTDAYWHTQRKPLMNGTDGQEMFLNLVDSQFQPLEDDFNAALYVSASCFNRALDNATLIDPEKTHFQLSEESAPLTQIQCIIPFTPIIRRPLRNGLRWQLISHLTSEHLSLAHPDITRLKEILNLYNFRQSDEAHLTIESLSTLSVKKTLLQITIQGIATFVQGIQIEISLDKNMFSDSSIFLFASVLNTFLQRYASINTCIQLLMTDKNNHAVLYKSSPQLGQVEAL